MQLRRKRGKGERRKRGWRKEKGDHFWSKRKEKREVARRKRHAEEELLEKKFPVIEDQGDLEKKRSIFRRWEYTLSAVQSTAKYGPHS